MDQKKKADISANPSLDKSNSNTLGVFAHIESRYIPDAHTTARKLLHILSDGEIYSTHDLNQKLGKSPRGALQSIAKNWGFWHITNLAEPSHEGHYQLDPRHLTGIDGDDSRARIEAEIKYRQESFKQVRESFARCEKAERELEEAVAKLEGLLGSDK